MQPRTIAFGAILFALISLGVYWFVTRPTPEETALKKFFHFFREGDYVEAEEYTIGDDFYLMAAKTKIRDTDGTEYLIGDILHETQKEILRNAIETYVKPHLRKWEYLSMETQRLSMGRADIVKYDANSVVKFRVSIAVMDYTSGNVLGESYTGRVEGTAHMAKENDEWGIEKFDLNLFSDNGLLLKPYLIQVQFQYLRSPVQGCRTVLNPKSRFAKISPKQ
jgi:hypothetical protein